MLWSSETNIPSHVSYLQEIVDVVTTSTVKGINVPQLVGNESGDMFVPVYDWGWASHLSRHYRRFPGVKSYKHFRVSDVNPDLISYKEWSGSAEETFDFARLVQASTLPPVIQPAGLDEVAEALLYEQIREFCKEETRDLVCPEPED